MGTIPAALIIHSEVEGHIAEQKSVRASFRHHEPLGQPTPTNYLLSSLPRVNYKCTKIIDREFPRSSPQPGGRQVPRGHPRIEAWLPNRPPQPEHNR